MAKPALALGGGAGSHTVLLRFELGCCSTLCPAASDFAHLEIITWRKEKKKAKTYHILAIALFVIETAGLMIPPDLRAAWQRPA